MRDIYLFLILLFPLGLAAQEVATFTVKAGETCMDAPVSLSLSGISYNTDIGMPVLYEIKSGTEKQVPCQLEPGHVASLWFILNGVTSKNSERRYVLKLENSSEKTVGGTSLEKDHKNLVLLKNNKPVLAYHHAVAYPPDSVSELFRRSGFIHPLWSPEGEVLTRIQAPDHYHHYGIWGPWTKTVVEGRPVDFWNLGDGQGTVRFAGFISQVEGPVYSGFNALQQHVDFGGRGSDQVAMNELLDVRLWNTGENVSVIDYTTTLNSPLDSGILLAAYRYGGGIGFRAAEKWHKDNSTVLTSEGKTRIDADGSNARWCIIEGESDSDEGRSGILFLSHPSNRMHPEPMRVWPADANGGRGDMYFEFVPIRHNDWNLEPGRNYTLKYRMIVFDGKMDAQQAERYWNSFAGNYKIGMD